MAKLSIQQAIEQAKANPNSEFATQLRKAIESGQLDQSAQKQGVDLSVYGRPKAQSQGSFATDLGSDLKMAGQEIKENLQKRAENVQESRQAFESGEQSTLRTAGQTLGQAAGSLADTIGTAFKTVIKTPLSQEQETNLKKKIGETLTKLSESEFGQRVSEEAIQPVKVWYEGLEPEQQRDIDALGGIGALVSEFVGAGTAKRAVKEGVDVATDTFKQVKGSLKNQWDELSKTVDEAPVPTIKPQTVDEALKAPEFGLTKDIAGVKKIGDESQFLTVPEKKKLLEIDSNIGNEYLDTLFKSEDDFNNITPFEKAVQDTEKVVENYSKAVQNMGGKIGKIKDKLKTMSVDNTQIDELQNEIAGVLKGKGIAFDGLKFKSIRGVNSPFTKADIKALNTEITDTLKNIKNSSSMENLLLGMERLDNKINFNLSGELTNSLQGVSKSVRGKLKSIRDKALSKNEAKVFEEFSEAKGFIDDFMKGNSENKIMTLLNVVGSKRDLKLKRIAEEIKRVTGQDITDYAYLARILSEASGSQSRNRSLLNQYIGEAVSLSPTGIGGKIIGGIANKIINVDKLKEIQKAIKFSPEKVIGK